MQTDAEKCNNCVVGDIHKALDPNIASANIEKLHLGHTVTSFDNVSDHLELQTK